MGHHERGQLHRRARIFRHENLRRVSCGSNGEGDRLGVQTLWPPVDTSNNFVGAALAAACLPRAGRFPVATSGRGGEGTDMSAEVTETPAAPGTWGDVPPVPEAVAAELVGFVNAVERRAPSLGYSRAGR